MITANTNQFQDEMNAIWNNLLPAFTQKALDEDPAGQEKLKQMVWSLEVHSASKEK